MFSAIDMNSTVFSNFSGLVQYLVVNIHIVKKVCKEFRPASNVGIPK